ncbi:MAG: DNA polymerase III subunit delta [Nitrospiraceae bacterium]|nr:MAG: DNA polymerase III subunit delta [Nitrospiraceae bacterium]
MSFRNFTDEIKKGLPSPVYLLVASDYFLHTEAVSLIKGLVPEAERDFNFHSFDLLSAESDKLPFEQILDVVNTASFFAGRKFVVVENVQKLLKKDILKLENYLRNPSDGSSLILLNSGTLKKELKERLTGVKQIVLDIRERDIPAWLQERVRMKGFEISEANASYLLGVVGPDLGMLSSELEKLMLAGSSKIEKKDIVELVEGKRTYSTFALIDAIKARDTEKTFKIYNVLKQTEEPYSLLGALNWQYGQFAGTGGSSADRDYYCKVFDLLHKADVAVKSSGSFYPFELLLVKLLRLSRKAG